jgi:hypothetical protein
MLRAIPLMTLVVIVYFAIAFLAPDLVDKDLLALNLPSGRHWALTTGGLLLTFGLMMIFLEVLKSARTSVTTLIDHGLSFLLFTLCLVLFLIVPQAGTQTFFLILIMTALDVISGFTVTLAASRRSVDIAGGVSGL